jgi:calcineurin-like phosphoesterase family protein
VKIQKYFYTSDTHFGHERIIDLCNRPFTSVYDMNESLINNWNSLVSQNDVVYCLGDMVLGEIAKNLPLIARLNGYKILIPGNHNRVFSNYNPKQRDKFLIEYSNYFDEILDEKGLLRTLSDGKGIKHSVLLCHFPYFGDSHNDERFVEYRPTDDGLPLLHGHVHERWHMNSRQFNVGVDVNNYAPVPKEIIAKWLSTLL